MCNKTKTRKATQCFVCKTKLVGRANQIYCSQTCKNAFFDEIDIQLTYLQHVECPRIKRNCVVAECLLGQHLNQIEISRHLLFEFRFDLNSMDLSYWVNGKKEVFKIGRFIFWFKSKDVIIIKRIKNTIVTEDWIFKRYTSELNWLKNGESLNKKKLLENSIIMELITVIPFILLRSRNKQSIFTTPFTKNSS